MILIADCGATKGSWMALDRGRTDAAESAIQVTTPGINVMQMSVDDVYQILQGALIPALDPVGRDITEIRYYGAGCIDDAACRVVNDALGSLFPSAEIFIGTDLLGAARALCGRSPGIACILGTGANSCLYDGNVITANIPPLGYILGDEGSGAVIGRMFLADLLKGLLPAPVADSFYETYNLDYATIIRRVYRTPGANAFMASFCPFVHANLAEPSVAAIVDRAFRDFFHRNVMQYPSARSLPIGFVGSVACHFRQRLEAVACEFGCTLGSIVQHPLPLLAQWHLVYDENH